jgi:broad specificity phosphatase PhoE
MPSDAVPLVNLVLVRHGESTWNERHIVQGQAPQAELTARGRAQAEGALDTLAQWTFDHIYSSDLVRARETAEIFSDALDIPVEIDVALRERSYGVLEGGPSSQLIPAATGIEGHAVVDDNARPDGGESLQQLSVRAAEFVEQRRVRNSGQSLLVVTHGGTIRALLAACAGVPLRDCSWDSVRNCSVWPTAIY